MRTASTPSGSNGVSLGWRPRAPPWRGGRWTRGGEATTPRTARTGPTGRFRRTTVPGLWPRCCARCEAARQLSKVFWGRRRPTPGGPRKQASVRRNVSTNYLVQVTLVLVGFLTTPLLTHELGIVRFGVWALIGSLIPYLELLELGFANATIAFVTKHLELDDDEMVHATLNTSFLILAMLGCLAFVIVIVAV